jgi:hypothetical protein
MSEDAPREGIIEPKNWSGLDSATQERVIGLFVLLAVRLVAHESEHSSDSESTLSDADILADQTGRTSPSNEVRR